MSLPSFTVFLIKNFSPLFLFSAASSLISPIELASLPAITSYPRLVPSTVISGISSVIGNLAGLTSSVTLTSVGLTSNLPLSKEDSSASYLASTSSPARVLMILPLSSVNKTPLLNSLLNCSCLLFSISDFLDSISSVALT